MKASHDNAPSGLLWRYSWLFILTIGMAKRLLCRGFFYSPHNSMNESCKMLFAGQQQVSAGRIQDVQTQKSPELPALGLIAQKESVFFIAVTGDTDQSFPVLLHNLQCADDPSA